MGDYSQNPLPPSSPKLLRIIARLSGGEIKTEEEAFRVAVVFIAICLLLSGLILFRNTTAKKGNNYAPPAEAPAAELEVSF